MRSDKVLYPTRPLKVQGGTVEEYLIPDDKKAEVLEQLYIFEPVPALDEERFDLHEGKKFRVREFRVTWEDGHNFLVSPYYPSGPPSPQLRIRSAVVADSCEYFVAQPTKAWGTWASMGQMVVPSLALIRLRSPLFPTSPICPIIALCS